MGFVMEGIAAEAYDREYGDRQLLGRILGYFRPSLAIMAVVALAIVAAAVLDAALPVLVASGIDRLAVVLETDGDVWDGTAWIVVASLASGVIS